MAIDDEVSRRRVLVLTDACVNHWCAVQRREATGDPLPGRLDECAVYRPIEPVRIDQRPMPIDADFEPERVKVGNAVHARRKINPDWQPRGGKTYPIEPLHEEMKMYREYLW